MSEFHDYLNSDPYAWSNVGAQTNTGWHFCFARLNNSPTSQLNAYVLGDVVTFFTSAVLFNTKPSTEEFPPRQTLNAINDVTDASSLSVERAVGGSCEVAILCTSQGHLYVVGNEVFDFANNRKLFGLGPEIIDNRIQGTYLQTALPLGNRTKTRLSRLTRVLGEGGDLEQVQFKSVTSHEHCLAALDSNGSIWFSGDPCTSGFTVEGQFPNDPGGLLSWFRKADFASYEDASGTVTPAQPLAFKKIRAGGTKILALGEDDHLYVWGTFNLGKELTSTRPHRVNGFVDSVDLVAGGSGYTTAPSVTASAPQHPDGTTAVFQVTRAGGAVTGISISNPGWGYTSAPTLTFSGGGGSGASATAALFSQTWLDCDASYGPARPKACVAISSDGKLYLNNAFDLYDGMSWFSPSSTTGFTSVSLGTDHGVLLKSDGSFGFWGRAIYVKPELGLSARAPLTVVSRSDIVNAQAFEEGYAILTDDGRVFTAGTNIDAGRGLETYNGQRFVPLNSGTTDGVSKARFSSIFGTRLATFLNRIESRDEFGNLLDPLPPGLPS